MRHLPAAGLFLALQLWSAGAPALAAAGGWIRLVVHRPGVVEMDGREILDLRGRTGGAPIPWSDYSMTLLAVDAGRHRAALRPADPTLMPPDEAIEFEVAESETLLVRLGRVRFVTSPPGARVLIGDVEVGTSPLWLDPTRLAGARFFVESPGFQRVTIDGDSVLARARDTGGCRMELAPLAPQTLPVVVAEPSRSWWTKHRRTALVGSTLLLAGGVTAGLLFKNEADDRYRAYRETGQLERQRALFGQAEKYDRLSLVSWGVGEAAFLTTFFLLIRQEPRGLVPTASVEPLGPRRDSALALRWTHEF